MNRDIFDWYMYRCLKEIVEFYCMSIRYDGSNSDLFHMSIRGGAYLYFKKIVLPVVVVRRLHYFRNIPTFLRRIFSNLN